MRSLTTPRELYRCLDVYRNLGPPFTNKQKYFPFVCWMCFGTYFDFSVASLIWFVCSNESEKVEQVKRTKVKQSVRFFFVTVRNTEAEESKKEREKKINTTRLLMRMNGEVSERIKKTENSRTNLEKEWNGGKQ